MKYRILYFIFTISVLTFSTIFMDVNFIIVWRDLPSYSEFLERYDTKLQALETDLKTVYH